MSYSVCDNNIRMTRGDTAKLQVAILTDSGDNYEPQTGDIVRFTMKRFISDKVPVLVKDIPIDTLYLKIEPNDTKNLAFGNYIFDIQLIYANGDVDTFIEKRVLHLSEEVD